MHDKNEMIFLFRTDLENYEDVQCLELDFQRLESIKRWNVDLDDCDRVLKVVAGSDLSLAIKKLLTDLGYFCEELI